MLLRRHPLGVEVQDARQPSAVAPLALTGEARVVAMPHVARAATRVACDHGLRPVGDAVHLVRVRVRVRVKVRVWVRVRVRVRVRVGVRVRVSGDTVHLGLV